MRIGILTDNKFLAESQGYLQRLCTELRAIGIEAAVVHVRQSATLEIGSRIPWTRVLDLATKLGSLQKFDALLVQYSYPLAGCLVFARMMTSMRPKLLVHTHGFDVFSIGSIGYGSRRFGPVDGIIRTTWKRADAVIAVSDATARVISSCGPVARLSIVPNGVDEDIFRPEGPVNDRMRELRKDGSLLILNVASLSPVKNHMRLLEAVSKLKSRPNQRGFRLVVVGAGPLKAQLATMIMELGLTDHVTLLGRITHGEMPAIYRGADLFVLPSVSEAHPWSVLEAMSCGLPVVAANVGGIPSTLGRGQALFDPTSVSAIADAIGGMLIDPGLMESSGHLNRQIVLERYTFKRHAAGIAEVLRRVNS